MREFAKSIFSFSWAMSLFGLQQTANLISPDSAVKAARAFDSVTETTEAQFSETLKQTFDAGDKLQQRATDMTLGLLSGEALNPNQVIKMVSDAAKQSAETLTKGVQSVTSTVRNASAKTSPTSAGGQGNESGSDGCRSSDRKGWGPMPS